MTWTCSRFMGLKSHTGPRTSLSRTDIVTHLSRGVMEEAENGFEWVKNGLEAGSYGFILALKRVLNGFRFRRRSSTFMDLMASFADFVFFRDFSWHLTKRNEIQTGRFLAAIMGVFTIRVCTIMQGTLSGFAVSAFVCSERFL